MAILITLPHGGPNAAFPVEELIRRIRASGRVYVIQGQQHVRFAEHTKPNSLDYWLRQNYTTRRDTAQATRQVVADLVRSGLFCQGHFVCPDSGHRSKGIALTDT